MRKASLVLTFILIFSSLFTNGASAAIPPVLSGGVYAEYSFAAAEGSDTSKNMSCQTQGTHTEYGLKLTPFSEVADSIKGGTTTVKNTQAASAAFNVTTAPSGYNDYFVEVEYLNYAEGFFTISYTNSTGKTQTTELVCCENPGDLSQSIENRVNAAKNMTESSSDTLTHIFRLEDVDFTKSKDFTIETTRTAKSSRFEYSPKSVYIKSVRVYRENKLPIKAEIKSDRTGNIFYDRDLPKFSVKFANNINFDVDISVSLNVYKYTNDGEAELLSELSSAVMTDETVAAYESITKEFVINAEEYGLYRLEADITASGRTYTAAAAEFSKCVGNDGGNASLGANVHSGTWDAGTLKNYMTLMRDAGFGIVREGVVWGSYEKSDGSTDLTNPIKGFYKITDEYGMEPYVVIDTVNPSVCIDPSNNGLVDSSALDSVSRFVEKLLDDPAMQGVNHFEICNEPMLKVYYDEDEKKLKYTGTGKDERTAVYTAKGKAYGKICERVIDTIRAKRGNDAEIGILSICNTDSRFNTNGDRYIWNGSNCADNFVKGTLDYLSDPNGDGNKSDSKLGEVDAITYHPYSYNVNPEVVNERLLTVIDDIAESYGLKPGSSWHTELGWSTAKFPTNVACIGDDYAQAKNIIRQYASMYTRNNNDKLFIYDLLDDDIVTNAQESNYGLVHSELYDTPYAAKLSYLAVSNLNKMVQNLPKAEFVYNTTDDLYTGDYKTETNGYGTKGEMAAKFSGDGNRKVYMLWSIEDDKEINYKIPETVIAYYDYLGNKIDPETVETTNGYKVSSEPIYAVCGEDNTASVIDRIENSVKLVVEGNTSEENRSDTVIVLISSQDAASSKDVNKDNLLYASFCEASASGYYRFDCGAVTPGSKAYAYIIEADGTETKTELSVKHNRAELRLCRNMQIIGDGGVSVKDLAGVSLIADLNEDVKSYPDAKLIFSFSKSGKITHISTKNIDKSYAQESLYPPLGTEYDAVNIFLWEGLNSIKPLCESIYIN